ncbi:MAG: NAD(P)-dependent oxidoreductase [Sarcina sp.]|nr:NAD(P)-dependent oxidoreductase [Sarcina sp.]
MKVVVTGAGGYMGRYVVRELLARGHEVIAVDLHYKEVDSRAVYSDVRIFSGDRDICQQLGMPDVCIHLAWQDGFIHNSPKHMENLSDHFLFLKNMIEGGCRQIAVMGTMHEVGFWEGCVTADTPCRPLSQYGIAKNALRQSLLLLGEQAGASIYWLRAFYILGDDSRNSSVFTKLLEAHEIGRKEFPFTTGENQYDFISVKELAAQIVAASTQTKYTGIINVCSGKPVSLKDKVNEFIAAHGLDITLQYGAFPERPYDSKIIYGDNTIIRRIMEEDGSE